MFGSKKRVQAIVVAPPPPLTIPDAREIADRNDFGGTLAEYKTIATAIAFQNPAVVVASLREFLRANKILHYPYGDVADFLTQTAARAGKRWIWKALRDSDSRLITKHRQNQNVDYSGQTWQENGFFSDNQYLQAVPLTTLVKVKKIVEGFSYQEHLAFGVSSYEAPRPDPFLCVVCPPGQGILVIDHWDEPGFRANT